MNTLIRLSALGGLLLMLACRPPNNSATSPHEPGRRVLSADRAETPALGPTRSFLMHPTMEDPVEGLPGSSWQGHPMPFFMEVIQTTIMDDAGMQPPLTHVGVAVFSYNPNTKELLLHPSVFVPSHTTEVLVGVTTVLRTPGQAFQNSEIVQFPSAQPALIKILALDAASGIIHLACSGESHELSPGETLTCKKTGPAAKTPMVITTVANHGRLSGIQPMSADQSWR
jgi:hypothetical protein